MTNPLATTALVEVELLRQEKEAAEIRKHYESLKQWADFYRSRGLAPIIIEPGEKMPRRKGWQKERGTPDEFETNYKRFCNIGLNLGEAGGNLLDVDLDHPTALYWAAFFLPDTPWKAGRPSNPRSHWFYKAKDGTTPVGTKRLRDPDPGLDGKKAMIVEQRWTGTQTVVCPSIHPSGETYLWSNPQWHTHAPAEIDPQELFERVRWLYAAVMMDKMWRSGQRYLASVPFIKAMLDRKVNRDVLQPFMETLDQGGTTDWKYQINHTLERVDQGTPCQGARTLIKEYGMTMPKINKIAWSLGGHAENDQVEKVEHAIAGIMKGLKGWNSKRHNITRPIAFYTMFQPGEVSIVAGVSNSYKTQFMLWHGAHFGLGVEPYSDLEALKAAAIPDNVHMVYDIPPKDRSFCLYVSPDAREEDLSNHMQRLFITDKDEYIGAWRAQDLGEAPNFSPVARSADDVDRFEHFKLDHPNAVANNVDLINSVKAEVDPNNPNETVGLVIYDTLARMGGVDDELNNSSLTKMIEVAEKIATSTNVAVVIVHHVSQAQHGLKFKEMDPRIFGRGGTATAAAARMAAGVMIVENTDGRVLGMKMAANNMPPRSEGLFWEICPEDAVGCHYFKPLTPEQVKSVQELEVEKKKEEEDQEPIALDLHAVMTKEGVRAVGFETVCLELAKIWPTKNGQPRSYESQTTKTKARQMLAELKGMGLAAEGDAPAGERGGRKPKVWVFYTPDKRQPTDQ